MDEHHFWSLIARIDQSALRDGDEVTAVQPLHDAASTMTVAELEAFEELLAAKLYALDSRRHMDEAGEASNSQDGFLYARCFVVASGKVDYERVLADPTRMPKSVDECEELLSVASKAYEKQTGGEWTFITSVSYETGSNGQQWGETIT